MMNPIGNKPPNPPIIIGPTTGKAGEIYEYAFVTSDPDDFNEVCYFVNWGDGTTSNWIDFVTSGVMVTLSHTWEKKATYTIFAKAKYFYDIESEWETFEVIIPRTRALYNIDWLSFLERFPILQQLIQLLEQ